MAVTTFKPEMWAPVLLGALNTKLVYKQLVNTDYQGEIAQAGDTVHINAVGNPTIAAYSGAALTYETLTTADTVLAIDQAYEYSFVIDDVDARQAAGSIVGPALTQAAWGLANSFDAYVAALYTDAAAANKLGTVAVTTSDLAYQKLIALKVVLDKNECPDDGRRWVTVPPWYVGLLLDNNKFVANPQLGGASGALNGHVGQAAGFNVYVSNQNVNTAGDDWEVFAGHPVAIAAADQIVKNEALRSPDVFGDLLRGLYVFGAKMLRPTCVATMVASIT